MFFTSLQCCLSVLATFSHYQLDISVNGEESNMITYSACSFICSQYEHAKILLGKCLDFKAQLDIVLYGTYQPTFDKFPNCIVLPWPQWTLKI